MATNEVYELALRQKLNNQAVVNTLHFQMIGATATPTQAQLQALADACKEVWRGMQSNQLSWQEWSAKQVDGQGITFDNDNFLVEGGHLFEGAFTGTLAGGEAVAPVAQQVANVVSLKTGLAGRSKRGRLYIGGIATNRAGSDGKFTASHVSGLQSAFNTFLGTYGSGGTDPNFTLVAFSFLLTTGWKPNPSPPPAYVQAFTGAPGASYWAITSAVVRDVQYTQRRRVLGVGT